MGDEHEQAQRGAVDARRADDVGFLRKLHARALVGLRKQRKKPKPTRFMRVR